MSSSEQLTWKEKMMIGLVRWCVERKIIKLIVGPTFQKMQNTIPNLILLVSDYCWDEYKKGGK